MNLQIFTVLSTLSAYLPGDGVQAAVEGPGVVMVHLGAAASSCSAPSLLSSLSDVITAV